VESLSQRFAIIGRKEGRKELIHFNLFYYSDTTVYAISTELHGVPRLMRLLADAVLRPKITEEELHHARQTALYEIEDMQMRPEQEMVILEMTHAAGWQNNSLGFPRYCPQESSESITREEILRFMKTNFRPERIVVSGVGVDHQELVDLTKEYFDFGQTTWEAEGVQGKPIVDEVAKYTGGELKVLAYII
jgi:processing peptidase subunit alpha